MDGLLDIQSANEDLRDPRERLALFRTLVVALAGLAGGIIAPVSVSPAMAAGPCDTDSGVLDKLRAKHEVVERVSLFPTVSGEMDIGSAALDVSTAYIQCSAHWIGKKQPSNMAGAELGSALYVMEAAKYYELAEEDPSDDLSEAQGDAAQAESDAPDGSSIQLAAKHLLSTINAKIKSIAAAKKAASQNPPSLSETEGWLKLHLPTFFGRLESIMSISQTASYSFDGCILSVNVKSTATPTSQFISDVDPLYVVDAQATDDSIKFGMEGVGDVPLGRLDLDSIVVKEEDTSFNPLALGYDDFQLAFTKDDEDDAKRVAKALRHAAELCGAKAMF